MAGSTTHLEPASDFDFELVDDPEGCCLEDLQTLSDSMNVGADFELKHARVCLAWAASQGIGLLASVLERVALWLGGCTSKNDLALRAAVLIREFGPTARCAYNLRQIGDEFGVTKQAIHKHARHLRAKLFDKKESIINPPKVRAAA